MSIPNEENCPVSLDLLGRLMTIADSPAAGEEVSSLSMRQRAQLALFCYSRCHLRRLALVIAAQCDEASLVAQAGHAGAVLFKQSRNGVDTERLSGRVKRVSVARSVA